MLSNTQLLDWLANNYAVGGLMAGEPMTAKEIRCAALRQLIYDARAFLAAEITRDVEAARPAPAGAKEEA